MNSTEINIKFDCFVLDKNKLNRQTIHHYIDYFDYYNYEMERYTFFDNSIKWLNHVGQFGISSIISKRVGSWNYDWKDIYSKYSSETIFLSEWKSKVNYSERSSINQSVYISISLSEKLRNTHYEDIINPELLDLNNVDDYLNEFELFYISKFLFDEFLRKLVVKKNEVYNLILNHEKFRLQRSRREIIFIKGNGLRGDFYFHDRFNIRYDNNKVTFGYSVEYRRVFLNNVEYIPVTICKIIATKDDKKMLLSIEEQEFPDVFESEYSEEILRNFFLNVDGFVIDFLKEALIVRQWALKIETEYLAKIDKIILDLELDIKEKNKALDGGENSDFEYERLWNELKIYKNYTDYNYGLLELEVQSAEEGGELSY